MRRKDGTRSSKIAEKCTFVVHQRPYIGYGAGDEDMISRVLIDIYFFVSNALLR